MAGTEGNKAVYWKNGHEVIVSDNATAHGIAISDTDVYLGGIVHGTYSEFATYWKNGTEVTLTNKGLSNVYGIGVSGTDVYAVGYVGAPNDTAVYWKNGEKNYLSPYVSGAGYGVAFSGIDFYIAGFVTPYGNPGFDSSLYWKNGLTTNYLAVASGSCVFAITVSGTDIYSAGNFGQTAAYWKNSNLIMLPLPTGYLNASAFAITVKGADVYLAGVATNLSGKSEAVYWKNGVLNVLAGGYKTADASGIAIAGNDIYVVGTIFTGTNYVPVYWKNGVQVELAKDGEMFGIAIGN